MSTAPKMNVKELREIAKTLKIPKYSSLNKTQLEAAIAAAPGGTELRMAAPAAATPAAATPAAAEPATPAPSRPRKKTLQQLVLKEIEPSKYMDIIANYGGPMSNDAVLDATKIDIVNFILDSKDEAIDDACKRAAEKQNVVSAMRQTLRIEPSLFDQPDERIWRHLAVQGIMDPASAFVASLSESFRAAHAKLQVQSTVPDDMAPEDPPADL